MRRAGWLYLAISNVCVVWASNFAKVIIRIDRFCKVSVGLIFSCSVIATPDYTAIYEKGVNNSIVELS